MNTTIKKFSALFLLLLIALYSLKGQNVAINISGNTAYQGAILDLSNNNLATGTVGFLPPYVTLVNDITLSPVLGTAANLSGLLVYNTSASTSNGLSGPGLYYWSNTSAKWIYMGAGSAATVNANNGLSVGSFTAGYVELGGTTTTPAPLLGTSVISGSGFNLDFDLGTYTATGTGSFLVTNGGLTTPLLSVTSTTPGVGININPAVSTLDDNGSYGVGITKLVPAASTTTTLTGAYSTVMATPAGVGTTYTLALPSANAYPRRIYTIVYNGNSIGTIDITSPTSGSIIQNGAAVSPLVLTSGAVTLQSDGANWNITSTNAPSNNIGPYFQTGGIAWITSGTYSWTVPAGITQLEIFLTGGGGGTAKVTVGANEGGNGGIVTGVLAVSPGEVLSVTVGAGGTAGGTTSTGLGGGGGGTYITSSGTLLCGSGGGGGCPGNSATYYELIGGLDFEPEGFGGGGWFSNVIANLAGGAAVSTTGAVDGPGGANYTGYLLYAQSYHGIGPTNNPTSGTTFGGGELSGEYSMQISAFQGATTNGATLRNGSIPTNANPNAGLGADATNFAGATGEAVIIW